MSTRIYLIAAASALALTACAQPNTSENDAAVNQTQNATSVLDAANLNELMLTISNPEDAVAYFRDGLKQDPDRVDFKRGYALSLARARRHADAVLAFEDLAQSGQADDQIRLEYAHSLARLQRWDDANAQMSLVSPALENPRRYLIVAMLADHASDWPRADRAYERARLLSPNPASILNNWGVSRMSRGEYDSAQRTFEEALAHNPRIFNAKNNLAVSRALQGEYRLPLVTVSEEERATLLHNIGVIALRRGDREQAKGLFTMALEAHPRYYVAAAEKLAALESIVEN
ncbi:MAG: tetratricopeptide repeat protein [Pseudomonadota bacterium]